MSKVLISLDGILFCCATAAWISMANAEVHLILQNARRQRTLSTMPKASTGTVRKLQQVVILPHYSPFVPSTSLQHTPKPVLHYHYYYLHHTYYRYY